MHRSSLVRSATLLPELLPGLMPVLMPGLRPGLRSGIRSGLMLARRLCTENKTHFGFETVTPDEKSQRVNSVFSNVASKYDLMNDVMSAGVHRCWKKRFIEKLEPLPNSKLLDVAGGTGDIAFQFVDYFKGDVLGSEVTVCDFNANMLRVGQERAKQLGYNRKAKISWIEGDAQQLPFEDDSFDAYTIAFGIRNVVDINRALEESYRVLKPGGIFMCLEFSKVNNPLLERAYDWYSFNVIPVLGELFARDYKSYKYLVESIRRFPDQGDFKAMIEEAGYQFVEYENLTFGVAAIHTGYKAVKSTVKCEANPAE